MISEFALGLGNGAVVSNRIMLQVRNYKHSARRLRNPYVNGKGPMIQYRKAVYPTLYAVSTVVPSGS